MDCFSRALCLRHRRAHFSFIFLTFSDRFILPLVRDAVDIGMVARPRVIVPQPPRFYLRLVFRASRSPRVLTRAVDSPSTMNFELLFPTYDSIPHKLSTSYFSNSPDSRYSPRV